MVDLLVSMVDFLDTPMESLLLLLPLPPRLLLRSLLLLKSNLSFQSQLV